MGAFSALLLSDPLQKVRGKEGEMMVKIRSLTHGEQIERRVGKAKGRYGSNIIYDVW
jgi:hypothetical protein